jgi:2-oxoglutarate dehydrogenase E2 component (dihydrolipoamide succinyltransferase)
MSSEVEIRAPAEQTEGTRSQILRWLKAVGDTVAENEPLIEIETDKVTVEVASPGSGTLREILKQEQEEIAPGDLLGRIAAVGASAAAGAAASARGRGVVDAAPSADASAAHGSRAANPPGGAQELAALGPDRHGPSPDDHDAASGTDIGRNRPMGMPEGGSAALALSPAVRRLLAERGLDAFQVRGTGLGGRITVEDVLQHGAAGTVAKVVPMGAATPVASVADAGATALGPSRRVPHSLTRKRIAEHMVQSLLHTAPHVTTVFEADLTAVLEHRARNKDDFAERGAPLTLTAYFLEATAAAIRAVPEANSRWTEGALEIFESMHIGVATALETGLVVPVLRDVQSRDLFEIAKGLEDLVSRAREGRLSPADVRGGTFTISNHGVSGSLVATPIIINQPQSAILGIGKLEKRPVVSESTGGGEDRIVIRPRCYVTLTIDHRVMDGHQANRFLQTFVQWLATPRAS